MTEFGAVTAMPMGDRGRHLGSVGLPLPGVEIRIVDPDRRTRPTGETGEVTIGGTRPARHLPGQLDIDGDGRGSTDGCTAATSATSTATGTSGSSVVKRR